MLERSHTPIDICSYLENQNIKCYLFTVSFDCRTIELIALVAISSTLFLFLHTRELHSRLRKMEVRLQPAEDELFSGKQLFSGEYFHKIQALDIARVEIFDWYRFGRRKTHRYFKTSDLNHATTLAQRARVSTGDADAPFCSLDE